MATLTFSDQAAQPIQFHAGTTTVRKIYNTGGTLTASDVLLGVKVPSGCRITDCYLSGVVDNDATILKLGVNGGAEFIASETFSATNLLFRATAGLPHLVSLSDNANPAFQYVTVTVNDGGTDTASASLELVVTMIPKDQ